MMKRVAGSLMLLIGLAGSAFAQNPANPTQWSADYPAADFTGIDGFVVGYFSSATAQTPVQQSATMSKASGCAVSLTDPTLQSCTEPLSSRPTAFQTWYVGIKAVAGTVSSAWSSPLVPFDRVPAPPVNVRVK